MSNLEITIQLDPAVVEKAIAEGWQSAFTNDTYRNQRAYGLQLIERKFHEYLGREAVGLQVIDMIELVVQERLRETTIKVVDDLLRGTLKKQLQAMLKDGSLVDVLRDKR